MKNEIIRLLQQNARMSAEAIGEILGISAAAAASEIEKLEKDVARRVVDFLSGVVYGVDGNIQKVASGIFLLAPYNVGIMGDFKDELKKGFPWSY